ncbi:MAG: GNAT family N-acetyltransferase [Christensenellaceae bacterium]|jgi:L-amino acid N-acyltransferase YncA|nr:GNAT family N-acetyltransferase [Christensenellaceae bacterium]
MRYEKAFELRGGEALLLRSVRAEDAPALAEYLREMDQSTPYLTREPGEIVMDAEWVGRERAFLREREEAGRSLMLLAFHEEKMAGNCFFSPVSARRRLQHRAEFGISVLPCMQGRGLGHLLMETALGLCKGAGFEQAELEVASENLRAVSLYLSLGFEVVGRVPHLFKNGDGGYFDGYKMMRFL